MIYKNVLAQKERCCFVNVLISFGLIEWPTHETLKFICAVRFLNSLNTSIALIRLWFDQPADQCMSHLMAILKPMV